MINFTGVPPPPLRGSRVSNAPVAKMASCGGPVNVVAMLYGHPAVTVSTSREAMSFDGRRMVTSSVVGLGVGLDSYSTEIYLGSGSNTTVPPVSSSIVSYAHFITGSILTLLIMDRYGYACNRKLCRRRTGTFGFYIERRV